MGAVFSRLVGLAPRELRRALPFFAYLVLTMAGAVSSKSARDALFLEDYRAADLPLADIAIALIVSVVVTVYIRAGRRLNLRNLQVACLLAFAASALGLWWWTTMPAHRSPALAIYVWVGVLSALGPAQVWTLANFVLTTREAKRAFGLVGSGAIMGWVAGGFATRVVVSRYGTESMLLLTAATQLLCVGLVLLIWRRRLPTLGPDAPADGGHGLRAALDLIAGSRYLRAIGAVLLLSSLVTTVEAWQFKAMAKAAIPDTDELTIFFGTFNFGAGLVSLVLQLFFTWRVLRFAGVGATLFVVPVALTVTSVGVLAFGTLLAAIMLRASDQVLRYSVDKSTVELLYLPVPSSQTFSVKSVLDTVIYRMGDGLGGLVVLVFSSALGWSAPELSWVCLVLLAAWMAAAAVARRHYLVALEDCIHQHRLDTERASSVVLERNASKLLGARLAGVPSDIGYALGLLEVAPNPALGPAVRGLLSHPAPAIRRQALAVLSRAGDPAVTAEARRLLGDPDADVRTQALLCLTENGALDALAGLGPPRDGEELWARVSRVAHWARPGPGHNAEAARALLAQMADESGPEGQSTRVEAARLIGLLPGRFDRELRVLLDDGAVDVAQAAISSAAKLGKLELVGRIIGRMQEPALVPAAIEALATFGDRVVVPLREALVDGKVPLAARREIPAVLLAIATPAAQAVLTRGVLDRDVVLRYHCITALNRLAERYPERAPDRRLIESVLAIEVMHHFRSYQAMGAVPGPEVDPSEPGRQGLKLSMERDLERIFRLLKMLYPGHDMLGAYVGVTSGDPVVQDNAIEFLDTLLPAEIRAVLMPVLDRNVSIPHRIAHAGAWLGLEAGEAPDAVEMLAASRDWWARSCAAYVIGELRLRRFAPLLERWSAHPDLRLRAAARDALDALQEPLAAATEGG